MNIMYVIMVVATMQFSDPILSHYQAKKFNSIEQCAVYLGENKIKLTHELIHALENLDNDSLLDLEFSCVKDKGTLI
mgnify:CR=1 FL=1